MVTYSYIRRNWEAIYGFKCDFLPHRQYVSHINNSLRKGHCVLKDGFLVSVEQDGRELGGEAYDDVFQKKIEAFNHSLPYYGEIIKLARKYKLAPKNVLEIGAGFGSFAVEFVDRMNPIKYVACEFAPFPFSFLRDRSKKSNFSPLHKNIYDLSADYVETFDCVIALEVLEHIKNDLGFLNKVSSGADILMTLPTQESFNHVRMFLLPCSVWERYHKVIDIKEIAAIYIERGKKTRCPKWWAIIGKKI